MRGKVRAALLISTMTMAVSACGAAGDDPNTISVAYHRYGNTQDVDTWMQRVKKQYEKTHPGKHVKLEPVVAPEGEYLSKLQLRLRSGSTAPDVIYEDSFNVNTDVEAGYLEPLDARLANWPAWNEHFRGEVATAGKAADGKTYGVPLDTDARGLWYNKELFAEAGLPTDWKPKDWSEVLDAARKVHEKFPDVIGIDMPLGKAEGESVSMQTVEMLLYGTKTGTLYDEQARKWIAPSKGFTDAMRFVSTAVSEGLTQSKAQIADAQYDKTQRDDLAKEGKTAIRLDGSFAAGNWEKAGWTDWAETMAATPMPTQHGQPPGSVTLSGGWTLALSSSGSNKDAAFEFVKQAMTKDNVVQYAMASGNLPARSDAAEDPRILEANPYNTFWVEQLERTHYRPARSEYPEVSEKIQQAVQDIVGGAQPAEVSQQWSDEVTRVVDAENTRSG